MEHNNIWVLTNGKGEFVKACATRESAKQEMENWRENCIKVGIFKEISRLDAVYYDRISFKVTDRDGKVNEMVARNTILY